MKLQVATLGSIDTDTDTDTDMGTIQWHEQ